MKVLIVDDHTIVRAGLRRLLSMIPNSVVEEAASGEEALSLVGTFRPDIVILDLNLPGMGGLDIIGRLRHETPRPQILVFSMYDAPIFAKRALEAGANGYVGKDAPPDQIAEAISRVADGKTFVGRELAQQLASWYSPTRNHPLHELSARDLEILRHLAAGKRTQQIADVLEVGYKTVANNLTVIKAKLGIRHTSELIRFANRELAPGSDHNS